MLKATDLRIGNYVMDEFEKIITVESIDGKGINLEIQDDGNWGECASNWIEPNYRFGALSGIPLTPEILDGPEFISLRSFLKMDITYVHQLQNIYYFLTGKELEINL